MYVSEIQLQSEKYWTRFKAIFHVSTETFQKNLYQKNSTDHCCEIFLLSYHSSMPTSGIELQEFHSSTVTPEIISIIVMWTTTMRVKITDSHCKQFALCSHTVYSAPIRNYRTTVLTLTKIYCAKTNKHMLTKIITSVLYACCFPWYNIWDIRLSWDTPSQKMTVLSALRPAKTTTYTKCFYTKLADYRSMQFLKICSTIVCLNFLMDINIG
jgi:hypothetical protein